MLLRHRSPDIDTTPVNLSPRLAHLEQGWVAVLRWLNANRVDFVVVGPVAYAIRGELTARGPVAIVPAPYDRNYERLSTALVARGAGLRATPSVELKLSADKLARARRWLLRVSGYDLDVDIEESGRYQELLYESGRFELAPDLTVEAAAPEDLEHFSHVHRTGVAPEFRVLRNEPPEAELPRPVRPGDASADS